MAERVFYVYVDHTKEEVPRPFYVGKGTASRVSSLKRNARHRRIAGEFGIDRRVVLETLDEDEALRKEVDLIAELHTYVKDPDRTDVACNLTPGGDGVIGINERRVTQRDVSGNIIATFNSVREVAAAFGVTASVLSNAFAGRGVLPVSMRGFEFDVAPVKRRRLSSSAHGNSMIVVEIDPDTNDVVREHASITDALHVAGVSYTTFSRALRTRDESAMQRLITRTGKRWAFKRECDVAGRSHIRHRDSPMASKIVIVTDESGGETSYSSVTHAANELGVTVNALLQALHGCDMIDGTRSRCAFKDERDISRTIDRSDDWRASLVGVNGIAVTKHDPSGDVVDYASIAQAERAEGFDRREIYDGLASSDQVIIDGFVWSRKVKRGCQR